MTPYYDHAGITIYHGDCRDILPHLEPVDLVLTDPPYGINITQKSRVDNRTGTSNKRWGRCNTYTPFCDSEPIDPTQFLSLPCCFWGGNYIADKLPPSSGWLIWDKKRPHDLDQASCEMAWTNFVKGARIFHFMWHGMLRDGKDYLCHPTQKPTELMKWVISLKWTPAGTILDPFMGSGTTLVAAKQLGRKAVGIEIEEKYCEIAVRRLQQEVLPL